MYDIVHHRSYNRYIAEYEPIIELGTITTSVSQRGLPKDHIVPPTYTLMERILLQIEIESGDDPNNTSLIVSSSQ